MRQRGSILVGVLWCLALLSMVVIGVLHTARMDLLVGKNQADGLQAHYLALAGIEKAKALLYREARERSRSGVNHSGHLYRAPEQFRHVTLGPGRFSVFRRGQPDEGGGVIYGVSDEESRLNANTASAEDLGRLRYMTPDVAAAIIDWRDSDNAVTPGGAEAEFYRSQRPPGEPRNGPLQTIRELLMVRGVTRDLLLARDTHQNGGWALGGDLEAAPVRDPSELGWAGLLTVHSAVENLNAAGQGRVDLQSADEAQLTRVRGITPEIARAIVAHRARSRFQSVADLLDVTAVPSQPTPPPANAAGPNTAAPEGGPPPAAGGPGPNPAGPKLINETLLMEIADDLTAQSEQTLPGVVNVNTAGLDVLACLPGLTRDLAQAIISQRESGGFFANIAGLLRVPGMDAERFKQLAPRVTARSETFRILSEGEVRSTGTRRRIQEIVRVGLQDVQTISSREDDL